MNIVFFGSDNFAVMPLQVLAKNGYGISCVVTQPDRKKGRRLSLSETAVKQAASELNLRIFQPEDVNSAATQEFLESLKAGLFVIVAYGQILTQRILDIPEAFCINLHASLLPKYRGAAPINWALIRGEQVTGVTVIKVERKMDAGPIILQRQLPIAQQDSALTLERKLSEAGSGVLLEALALIEAGSLKLTPQDHLHASFAPKLRKDDGRIDWHKSAAEICNLIRGAAGWPTAFTYYHGKMLKIIAAAAVAGQEAKPEPGRIAGVSADGIAVGSGAGALVVKELQMEGGRRMNAADFVLGHKISCGEMLGQ